jgi:glutathione peroxidase-family protein
MASATQVNSIYDFTPMKMLDQPLPLKDLRGKVILIVNVASKCGFTPVRSPYSREKAGPVY